MNFFNKSKLLGEVNATVVSLVPKITNASSFSDFRPIACCNVLYKCITKLMTVRMKEAVKTLVSDSQSAFIEGRYIQDNIMLTHELVRNYHRDHGPPRCAAKIDLKKAYDMVRWILINRFPQELLYDSLLHKDANVSALICDGKWHIPAHIQPSIAEIVTDLDNVELDTDSADEVVWTAGQNGAYTMKATYEELRHKNSKIDWSHLFWFINNTPRHGFIAWLAINNALKTLDKLRQWGTVASDLCVRCYRDTECISHLFFDCTYSAYIWHHFLNLLGYNRQILNWIEEVKWCSRRFAGSSLVSTLKKLTFSAIIYHIWAERNRRIYQHSVSTAAVVTNHIYTELRLKLGEISKNVEDTDANRQLFNAWGTSIQFQHKTPIYCYWSPPPAGWFKANSDGFLHGTIGGYGAVIRDEHGTVIAACTGATTGHTVIKHELQGIEAALKLISIHGIGKVIFSTDSAYAHSILTRKQDTPWELRHLTNRIHRALNELQECTIQHHFRETNRVVDHLAGLYPPFEFHEIDTSSFDENVKKFIHEDAIGRRYIRM